MSRVIVELASGPVTVSASLETPELPRAVVALAHGAGAGMDHPFLTGFAGALRDEGFATFRFTFPYLEAGRRMPGPAGQATATWAAVCRQLAHELAGVPVVAAGKSYGGRMASMAAAEGLISPTRLVYLGYPLHPPGDPAKLRAAHLPSIDVPQLFVEGSNDPFIQPLAQFEDVIATCHRADVHWVDGGGHSFEVKGRKRAAHEVGAELAAPVAAWLRS